MVLRQLLVGLAVLALAGSAAAQDAEKPKSNPLARVKVLSESERSISIKHSRWGEEAAFKWADTHCAKYGKVAVAAGGSPSGTSTITTWRCE